MDLSAATERTFRKHIEEHHWHSIDPDVPLVAPGAAEVRIGSLILDLVAHNNAGGITLIEFKVKATKDTLAQLLLYPRAFRRALEAAGCPRVPDLRVVLVSPFIDRGVVELVETLRLPYPIRIRLCVPDRNGHVKLVSPHAPDIPPGHCWEQSEGASQVGWDEGLLIRGRRLLPLSPSSPASE